MDATLISEMIRRFVDPQIYSGGDGRPGAPWPEAPDEQTAGLAATIDEIIASDSFAGLHGLVVVHRGQLVLERYGRGEDLSWGKPLGEVTFDPHTPHDVRSVTKSVVALMYGIALAGGDVPDPAAPLLAQFPEYPDLATDPARAGLTVEHALTMTLGLEWREEQPYADPDNGEIAMMLADDRWRYTLERPVESAPGERWIYCGGASELIGRLVAKGTGVPLHEYAWTKLFKPLGIGAYDWMAGVDGVASAASGLRLAPRDLARIGQAVLDGGGPVVPARWLSAAFQPYATTPWGDRYGYQWYLGGSGSDRWVGGIGNGDQRLFVYPERDLVVVVTTGEYDRSDGSIVAALVEAILAHCAAA